MRIIFFVAIIFLSACKNQKQTLEDRQQAIQQEMAQVKASYFKTSDSLERLKDADTSSAKHRELAEELVSIDEKKSATLIKLQKEYDSLELQRKEQ
jgi:hypothetical protein